jgi:arsenite methyltransferase
MSAPTTDANALRDAEALREQVRARYAEAATSVSGCCGSECCGPSDDEAELVVNEDLAGAGFGLPLYDADDRDALPDAAALASLGCGNPTAVAALADGETVLDLGSGGGIDVLLSARRVGPTGRAIGIDMTDEMLELARRSAAEAGATNVEFRKGHIEALPVDDGSVDIVISNCVINLSVDKPAVFAEMHRVLRPGGRLGISDIIAEDHLDADDRAARGSHVGCIAGALSIGEYRDGLAAAGFVDVDIEPTHAVADGMHSAIVRAVKPA